MRDRLKSGLEGRALPIVLFTVFLDSIGIGILFPILPARAYSLYAARTRPANSRMPPA